MTHATRHPAQPTALVVARALDRRLHATLEDPLHLGEARLYGCTVVDDEPSGDDPADMPVRFTFLGEAPVVYELLGGSVGLVARAFDAAAVVTTGWGAPVDEDDDDPCPPSRHPDRFRILVTTVVDDEGMCSVVRHGTAPDRPVDMPERGVGLLPDALETMWCGRVRGDAVDRLAG